MGIFRAGEPLGSGAGGEDARYRIRITTEDGETLYWHKRGKLHIVEEDVARVFVENFKPQLFQVRPDGSFSPPVPGETRVVRKVEMEAL